MPPKYDEQITEASPPQKYRGFDDMKNLSNYLKIFSYIYLGADKIYQMNLVLY